MPALGAQELSLRNPDDGHPGGRADATARFPPRHRRPRQADRGSATTSGSPSWQSTPRRAPIAAMSTLAAASVPSTPNEKTALLTTLLTRAELDGWTRTEKSGGPIDQAQRHAPRGALSAHRRPDQDRDDRQTPDLLRRHAGGQGFARHGPHPCLATKSPEPLRAAHPVPARTSSKSRATSGSAPCSCPIPATSLSSPTIRRWNFAPPPTSPAIRP